MINEPWAVVVAEVVLRIFSTTPMIGFGRELSRAGEVRTRFKRDLGEG